MASNTLTGKTVVVIGGASGIGYAAAEAAAAEGARVIVGSSKAEKVKEAARRLGGEASGRTVDVSDESSVGAFFERVGAFNHLIFSAGDWDPILTPSPIADLDLAAAASVFTVRFWGAVSAAKHAIRTIASDGSITLTGGVLSRRPTKGGVLSSAMCGAVEHLTQALAVELAPIRVNMVCPGLILTDVWSSAPEAQRLEMTKLQPMPRFGDPAEIAQAYLYAMAGRYTTGQVLVVDGGRTLV
jgi:NAD(P)-dependent dehydrogenase (short-subunit alcohol dehydrogenase family)